MRTERESRLRWHWGAVLACAVIIAVAAGIAMRGRLMTPSLPEPEQPKATAASTRAPDAPAIADHPALARNTQLAQMQTIRPKVSGSNPSELVPVATGKHPPGAIAQPEQFPTPTPLSPEEHALLALARTHPETLGNPSENDGKVIIPLIDIKLLPEPNGDSQGDN
jgi:hypothetical protein